MSRCSTRSSGLVVEAHVALGEPRAVHCKRERHHVYIGRPSKWGNPFVVGRDGTRAECIARYERWLLANDELAAALGEVRGKVLGCWCPPRERQGDVLVRLANASASSAHPRGPGAAGLEPTLEGQADRL